MFEFGRDLRKLFERARENDDLGWLELIGADLLEAEARSQAIDAGRVSCARPQDSWMRAAALWREHARRTGRRDSLDRAASAASDAARRARGGEHALAAALEAIEIHLAGFDLFGGPERLDAALRDLSALTCDRSRNRAWAASLRARLAARRARLNDGPVGERDAASVFDAALDQRHALPSPMRDELRLERAGAALEAGVRQADARLLDQAGRDLRALVDAAPPEQRPITRARALTLAALGLKALAALADDAAAGAAGQAMFAAAADQFTPDHSPLDWVAVTLAGAGGRPALASLRQAEALAAEPGLILGALARERRVAAEAALTAALGDLDGLDGLTRSLRDRAADRTRPPIDWAADQLALAHVLRARAGLAGFGDGAVGLMLAEAALTAREQGAPALSDRAEAMARLVAAT